MKVSEELKEEKSLNMELFDKTISLEQTGTEDKAKITKLNSELKSEKLAKEKLEKKIEVFTKWKAECILKVKSSSKLHVAKIEELEGKLSRQVEMLGEVAVKVPALVDEVNAKLRDIVALEEKVKV